MTDEGRIPPAPAAVRSVLYRWADAEAFGAGDSRGVAWRDGALRLTEPIGREKYTDPFGHGSVEWEYGTWTSPWLRLPFAARDIIPSWTADAPDGARITVRLRIRDARGGTSGWYVLAHWCAGDALTHRTTVPGQSDGYGQVDVDTLTAGPGGAHALRVAVDLARQAGCRAPVALSRVQAAVSRPPLDVPRPPARPGPAWGTVLDVPGRSQGVHTGHCPQWDGGGEAWAGPACTAMLVEFFGRGPAAGELAWLDPLDPAPQVDFAARQVYDYAYRGCGNWAFNTAYAARFGLCGAVVRLQSLADAEAFVAAGIPIATSLALRSAELSAAGSYTTAGNIMVVCGFTAGGDVVVNDPLAAGDDRVRRVYPRTDFERVWLQGGAGGTAYLVHPPELPLPPAPEQPSRW